MTTVTPPDRDRTATRLLRSSAEHSYDPEIEIDWDAPFAEGKYFVPPHRSSLYGTALWDRLTEAQRIELTKHEVASIAGLGVWFETILMQLLIRGYFRQDPTAAHAQYALTEIGDECRHSVMFGRMIARLGTPVYRPDGINQFLGQWIAHTATGPRMFAAILIAEEILDTLQREAMADEDVQPLVRMISRIHVVEEARHVRYAREELARQIRAAGRGRLAFDKLVIGRAAYLTGTRLVDPRVYRAVGIDPWEGRRAAWANPYHRETMRWAGERVVAYLTDLDLIGGPGKALWRASGLLPR
ncbi:AurF N-oxygenase family protein [Actinoplanes teichomyceticus]|uniref:Para-aminobenzoate N-oxygenase AurF n=1 Tax=Actinoplanes teichomyceticus TaxID=1867 RepID=A0A561WLB5_ACTTI|nr:diiron oxygenase [Actinoplanes teichomyceticus]TWG24658.1 para-aminobenzoate N-oxygenase AurF [Actinoplanes teichomyceticus]GIF14679.1 membrane protein [Actinoplanes teichomyceticus]